MPPILDVRIITTRDGFLRVRIDGRPVRIPETRDRGYVLALVADLLEEREAEGWPIVEADPVGC